MNHVPQHARRIRQAGYSLLMVVFMVATILIAASAAVPNLITQGRREREREAIWRGEQYARAIGLYFRRFGRYPTKIEDLTRTTNGVRFLRQAYTEPMNKDDGSWRFLYVGPNGQLIGSTRQTSVLEGLLSTRSLTSAPIGGAASGGSTAARGTGATSGAGQSPGGGLAPNPLQSQPQALQGAVIGGNIIGVGSKVKSRSLLVYKGGETYDQWEFVWSANQQVAIPGQSPAGPAPPPPPGQGPAGTPTQPGAQQQPGQQLPGQIPPPAQRPAPDANQQPNAPEPEQPPVEGAPTGDQPPLPEPTDPNSPVPLN